MEVTSQGERDQWRMRHVTRRKEIRASFWCRETWGKRQLGRHRTQMGGKYYSASETHGMGASVMDSGGLGCR